MRLFTYLHYNVESSKSANYSNKCFEYNQNRLIWAEDIQFLRITRKFEFSGVWILVWINPFPELLCPGEMFEYSGMFTLHVFTLSGVACTTFEILTTQLSSILNLLKL